MRNGKNLQPFDMIQEKTLLLFFKGLPTIFSFLFTIETH